MSRYIDADKLAEYEEHAWDWDTVNGIETATALRQVISDIRHEPTADVVEVVRCKYCEDYDSHDHRCKFFNHGIAENDYCSRVIERREDEIH